MAQIYWRKLKFAAIADVSQLINKLAKTSIAKPYWDEVLTYLNARRNGRQSLQ